MPRSCFAYVDETGDPGASIESSPIFGMACLLVTEDSAASVRSVVDELRATFRVPGRVPLSWKSHVRKHEQRKHVASRLASIDGVRLTYVYLDKRQLRSTAAMRTDRGLLYNYVAGKAYKNILWAARNWLGNDTEVHTRFGHVKGFDHESTRAYFHDKLITDPKVPSEMERGLKWVAATSYRESEAADLYAGFLKAAVWPDEFGQVESMYLTQVWHQVRTGPAGCRVPLGFMSMPDNEIARHLPWWSCSCSRCAPGDAGTSGGRST